MSFQEIVFYIFSAIMVISALRVITARNPVHSALSLVLTFFATAAVWLLLEAEFLAITLVLVYVGAVMVLFLFVVMMLDINLTKIREGYMRFLPIGLLFAVVLITQMVIIVGPENFGLEQFPAPVPQAADYSNTKELGRVLYTVYVYPFEIAAVILLVAIIAAITLTLRRRPKTRYQSPGKQVQVSKADRLRIVKMESVKAEPVNVALANETSANKVSTHKASTNKDSPNENGEEKS
jgi:NADH-quinone oxidoreductase subunit J